MEHFSLTMLIRKEDPDYIFPFFLSSISKLLLKEKKEKTVFTAE